MKRFIVCSAVLVVTLSAMTAFAQSNVDPSQSWAWSEIGWTNWRAVDGGADGVTVHDTMLSGHIWSEAAGWINLGSGTPADGVHYANVDGLDFGVNFDPATGTLSGLAWGEQTGWISFDTGTLGSLSATFDLCENRFRGYAWGEAVGWLNLDDATHRIALGPVCDSGDLVCDGVIALPDYTAFESFLGGPDVNASCPLFDQDSDGDIDLIDFASVQSNFSG